MSTEIGFVKLKLNRASEHITSIEKAISAYTRSSDSCEVRQDEEGKEKIHIIRKPPPDISILSGETVYQLRSALDQLAFILYVPLHESGAKGLQTATGCSTCRFAFIPHPRICLASH
jgi:hypothetical protein